MTVMDIAIYGGGGFAREVAWLIESSNTDAEIYRIVGFIDDNSELHGHILNNIPVFSFEEVCQRFPDVHVISGIGSPSIREKTMNKVENAGLNIATIIHPRVEKSNWVQVSDGTVICAGNILTTNIVLGRHVQINLDCTIGHDVIMGDYTTLAPGVHVSGWVHFGKRVYVGTGANIINGTHDNPLVIEDDVVIGAGACVTQSISTGLTVVGVPAKPLNR